MRIHPFPSRSIAVLEALATVAIWGATFVATKVALQEVSPATVVWLRFTVGIAVLGLAAYARHELSAPPRRHWPMLALLGFIGVALHQWLQSNGLRTAAATTTAWLVATTPIFIALLGWIALRETLNWVQLCGIGVGALGVLTILSRGNLSALLLSAPSEPGDILVLLSAPNWALYTILSRRVLSDISPSKMIFYVMLAGWLFITVWAFGFGPGVSQVGALTWRGWVAIGGLGVFGSGLAYVMYHDALHVLPAPQLGVFLNLEPLVTLLLAAPILGEALNFIVLLGGALIVVGIYLVNRRRSKVHGADVAGSVDIEGAL
ncbi:MAG TPA: EamA family transporter [Anaerolineales bacterium]|nr:EamA family transporter [Anaerolineales bacterium]